MDSFCGVTVSPHIDLFNPTMQQRKTVADSRCVMTEIVLPNDTNGLGNMMGGRLLHLMDIAAAISAQRHANRVCVTAAVDSVEFHSAILEGEVVIIESQVNRAFNTSMEIEINVWAENPRAQTKRKCNRAYFTFVAVDADGRPIQVPAIHADTDEEKERFEGAARRREFRLVLGGRLEIKDAPAIRDILTAAVRHDD
jgi:acyl-CoA hydrolase